MHCPTCNAENRDDRRFCAKCGTALPVACPACGFANDAKDDFCGGCGAPLKAAGQTSDKPENAAAAQGDRRQVTILFADLVGFTKLTGELGAEATHGILSRYLSIVDEIATGHGGSVEYIGDAVMALFGAPVAHSDDPLRAVRAAGEIHRAMPSLGAELGRALQTHIGIASGEVIAAGLGRDGKAKYTVIGDSVNLAARLDGLAGAGETLISDAVQRAVGGQFDCQSAGDVAVKGFDRPVRVWRVGGELMVRGPRFDTPFVGRQAELRQFAGIAEVCRETGAGRVILLRGEAGIGKTRLADAFTTAAEQLGFQSHRALVLDFGAGKGQDAIHALVRSLMGIPPGADKGNRMAAADAAILAGRISEDQRVYLNDLLNLPQPTQLRVVYDAMSPATRAAGREGLVAGLIRDACRNRPLLLLVEDVHWADASTMSFLAALARAVVDEAALLIMTTRIDGDPIDGAWRAAIGACPVSIIDLHPLREAEAVALATAMAAGDEGVVRQCIARAEGNPLFLEQLLRNAEDHVEDMPGSIQSLVQARLDRLDLRDRRALQAAAIIGQRFPLAAIRSLAEDAAYDGAPLLRHRLIRPEGDSYLFAHALIREGVYSSLLAGNRRDLHRKAADWYGASDATLRAQHLDRAEDSRAASAYLEAARAQAAAFYNDKALALIDRGLEVANTDVDRSDLMLVQGDLLHDLGEIDRSGNAYQMALACAPDDRARCRAWIGLAAAERVMDHYSEALALLESAQSAAAALDLKAELGRIHYMRGNLYFSQGRLEDCLAEHERALHFARETGSVEAEARALGGLGDAAYGRGLMLTARDYFRRSVDLARAHGLGRIEVANLPMAAISNGFVLALAEGLEDGRSATKMAIRVGHKRAEMIAENCLYMMAYWMADFDAARRHAWRGIELAQALKAKRFEAEGLTFLAQISLATDQSAEARDFAEQGLLMMRDGGMKYMGPVALGVAAACASDGTIRRQYLDEAEAILRDGALRHNYIWYYEIAIDIALATQEWDDVERYAAALEDCTRIEPLPLSNFDIARGRALAAVGRGRRDPELAVELRRLIELARDVRMLQPIGSLEAALAKVTTE